MKINNQVFDRLSAEAKQSPRLRMAMDLRNSADDTSQRMLNALEPGTEVPIHRHTSTNETLIVLRGRVCEILYDDAGNELERVEIATGTDCVGISVPRGQFHSVIALEPGTIIFEAKDGSYTPLTPSDIL